ncbi:MAG: 50S ribosomal protein L13 [bacterium]|nr:MAG: 50S ribosomal protein L13 [bacterium]
MKTFSPKKEDIERKWYVVDAKNQVLGRLASQVARLLRGKHKPIFAPHVDVGDHVIIINAEKIRVTGKKAQQKRYKRYSGYPSGLKETVYEDMLARHPERVLEHAIKGMLPKNRLGRKMFKKLRIYAGEEHPHEAQKPETLREWVGHLKS